jgi:hypothetical protein
MNRITKVAAIAAFSLTASAAAVLANDAPIRYLGELSNSEAQIFSDAANSKSTVEAAQKAALANPTVAAALKARNVNIANVIGTQKALDGSVIYIVR